VTQNLEKVNSDENEPEICKERSNEIQKELIIKELWRSGLMAGQ
jgi:hypothetical protein